MSAPRTPAAASPAKHALVSRALEQDLAQGRYRVGDTLPSEPELTLQFGVSRHTVRAALRTLQSRGLIAAQQGVGSVVQATTAQQRYTQGFGSAEDLLQYVASTRVERIAKVELTVDAALAGWLGCKPGERWWRMTLLRFPSGGERPSTLADVYLPYAFGALLHDERAGDGEASQPIFRAIEEQLGEPIAEIRQELVAALPTAQEAALLQTPASEPVLAIVRRYIGSKGQVLETTRTLHPGQQFTYTMNVRLAAGQG